MNKSIKKQVTVAKKQIAAIKAKASKMKMPKVSKRNALMAGAMAGATLLCTIAGVSLYLVRNKKKTVDFKKVKINVLNGVKNAHSKMAPVAAKASKMAVKAAKDTRAKIVAKMA